MHQFVAVVTGGGTGIGRAIAMALGGSNTVVFVAGRNERSLDGVVRLVEALGGVCKSLPMDITDVDSVMRAATRLDEAVPHVNVVVNNAGLVDGGAIESLPIDSWRKVIETNLLGP